jgi:hypothetical protein
MEEKAQENLKPQAGVLPLVLGARAMDLVSGFTGVIVGHATYLTGSDQFCVTSSAGADGREEPRSLWFDAERLTAIGEANPLLARPATLHELSREHGQGIAGAANPSAPPRLGAHIGPA